MTDSATPPTDVSPLRPTTIPSADRDHRLDAQLGRLLTVCTLAASIVIGAGVLFVIARHHSQPGEFKTFRPETSGWRSPSQILVGLKAGEAGAIAQAGLVMLMLTPVIRVAATLFAFIIRRDRVFIIITAIVLATLLLGIAGIVR
jgi:uncharacterized membrane protein